MLSNELLKKIKTEAVRLDWEVAFGGKANGNRHLLRVNKIIKFLVKNEGGDIKIAQAGGWVHDVSLAWGSDYDEKHVEKYTLKFLRNFKELTASEVEKIAKCATSHEAGGKKISLEAQIVHDADVIDKSGILGVIRHIWKTTNMLEKRVLTSKQDLSNIQKHLQKRKLQIYTQTGKHLAKLLSHEADELFTNDKLSIEIMNSISTKASEGHTSDQIARFLLRNKKNNMFKNLTDQLNCKYLINL